MIWFNKTYYEIIKNEHLKWRKENPALFEKIIFPVYASLVGFPVIMFPLYYARDQILPHFFFDLADKLKYDIFFDRYLYLIKQGGVEFADRFFIAYAIILVANAIVFIPVFTFGWIFVRRVMTPIKRFNKLMKWGFLAGIIVLILTVHVTLTLGDGLNHIGLYRANDSTLFHLLLVGSISPSTAFAYLVPMKFIFVAYDTWRDGTFREVFFSHT